MDLPSAAKRYLKGDNDPKITYLLEHESDEAGRYYFFLLEASNHEQLAQTFIDNLKLVIRHGWWKKWNWVGCDFEARNLAEYLTRHPPKGVGLELPLVERLIADDKEAVALYRRETTPQHGGDRKSKGRIKRNNVTLDHDRGNARAYLLERLQRERRDLFNKVKAGGLSAHSAAIEAGWIARKTPLEKAQRAWEHMSPEERRSFLEWIKNA